MKDIIFILCIACKNSDASFCFILILSKINMNNTKLVGEFHSRLIDEPKKSM